MLVFVAFGTLFAAAACGSSGTAPAEAEVTAPAASATAGSTASEGNAANVAPSATAGQPGQPGLGKPVVYWIHTNW